MFGTMIDTGQIFYAVTCTPTIHDLKVKSQTKNFYVKDFGISLFLNSVVYLFHVWHDDRCWSKILCNTIPNPYMTLRSRSWT